MPNPFDHLVLASHDLAAQALVYRAMGFQVGGLNQHPWGTQNRLVQLDGSFLELIGVAAGATMPGVHPAPRHFSFGGFVGHYLARRQGLAMLAMATGDAAGQAARLAGLGLGDFEPFHFGRASTRPDGSKREVSFTLAFAQSPLIDEAGFFYCQHHQPENFWAAALQEHPNTAQKLAGVVMVAENPAGHAEFLSHFLQKREMLSTSMGLEIDTGAGMVEVLTPLAAKFRYGAGLAEGQGEMPHFAGFRIGMRDMARAGACLAAGGIQAQALGQRLVVPPATAFGTAVVFEPLAAS